MVYWYATADLPYFIACKQRSSFIYVLTLIDHLFTDFFFLWYGVIYFGPTTVKIQIWKFFIDPKEKNVQVNIQFIHSYQSFFEMLRLPIFFVFYFIIFCRCGPINTKVGQINWWDVKETMLWSMCSAVYQSSFFMIHFAKFAINYTHTSLYISPSNRRFVLYFDILL